MTATLHKLSPEELQSRLADGRAVLVDIREADEFARSHVPGARSLPLSAWEQSHFTVDPDADVVFTCRTGMRTAGACDRLAARVSGDAYVLDGGLDAWARAGLPVEANAAAPLELARQVQIAAGAMVVTGVLLGAYVAPIWFGLAAAVGAGLALAGLTGSCALARVLMRMPWNRAGTA